MSTALLLIDLQVNMFDPENPVDSGDALLDSAERLLARARAAGADVFFVRNCGGPGDPDVRGTAGWQLHPRLQPAAGEPVFDKTTCDAFESTNLGTVLEERGRPRLVVVGLQSEYCIRGTVLGALAGGYDVTLVTDGHSTYDSTDRTAETTKAEVNAELGERVTLVPAEAVVFA